ncbi:MAG: response regulator transcription factor [Chitinophagaceae bacterium]|nr:response regulator transcription factor [Rubrivivax sp.]
MNQHDSSTPQIRVLVVDDHPLMREGIVSVVRTEGDMTVVGEAGNGSEAIEAYRRHSPDVTLMDLQMPTMDGVSATAALRAEWPQARVVVLTTFPGDAQALRALRAGASGYLLKSLIRRELTVAIRAAHAGLRPILNEVNAAMAQHVTDQELSSRELEVLKRVAAGSSNKRVANEMYLSEETVKSHMKNILSKLGANDRTHAVTIALRRGVIFL